MLFDAHNHIQDERLGKQLGEVLHRASLADVTRMAACASGLGNEWARLQKIGEEHAGCVFASFGLHPWHVDTAPIGWKRDLEHRLAALPSGMGEIGLDKAARATAPIEDQIKAFRWQLDLALERGLPVSIHCVKAWGLVLEQLRARPGLRFMLHAYGGTPELARELTALGAYLSFGSALTDPRRSGVAQALQAVAKDRLLLETDAPDGFRTAADAKQEPESAPAEPAMLTRVRDAAAKLLDEPPEEIGKRSSENALRFFGR
ncbi:MAG: TatD family hydrolase [Opitutales bacterium]|jgi:TatD DNase family protein